MFKIVRRNNTKNNIGQWRKIKKWEIILLMKHSDKEYIVYCHTNIINGKKYIGITCQTPEQRFRNGKGYKSSKHFYYSINKYGWDNFIHTILFEHLTELEAKEKEIELIAKYKTNDKNFGYNSTIGGDGYSGTDNPWFGKHHSDETKAILSAKLKGIPRTEEWKRKIRESELGRVFSEETKMKMRKKHPSISGKNNYNYGKPMSEERLKKMVIASKTPEAIVKMKQNKVWYSGKDNPNAKKVICLDNGMVFDTVNDASRFAGCSPSKVSNVCHGHRKHTKNLHFKFLEEKDD